MKHTERNEMLRREYFADVPVPDLMAIYGLSRSRLYQIVNPAAYEGQQQRAKEKQNAR